MTSRESLVKELEKCNACSSCSCSCPSYKELLAEEYSPRGRMQLYLRHIGSGNPKGFEKLYGVYSKCLLCLSCKRECPKGVDTEAVLTHARAELSEKGVPPLVKKLLVAGWTSFLPGLFSLPRPGGDAATGVAEFLLYPGCTASRFFPETLRSTAGLLKALSLSYIGSKSICCGLPALYAGNTALAKELIKKNSEALNGARARRILTLCPSCRHMLMSRYSLNKPVVDVLEFLREYAGPLSPGKPGPEAITFHYPCHALNYRDFDARTAADEFLGNVRESGYRPLVKNTCCGFGGFFCAENYRLSKNILARRSGEISKTGADKVLTSCPGCALQLKRAFGSHKVMHIMDFAYKNIVK